VASTKSTGQLQLQLDGTVLSEMAIPNTGNWQSWATITDEISLSAGAQTLRLYASGSDWNINWMNFNNTTPVYNTLPNVNVASYQFSSMLSSSDADLNTTAGNFTDGQGIAGGTSYWDGGRAVNRTVLTQLLSNAIANEDYFEFTVTPDAGVSLDLTALTFSAKRGGSSPDRIRAYCSADNYSGYKEVALTTEFIAQAWDLAPFGQLSGTVTFRFYVFGNNTGGTDVTRRAIIDNVVLKADIYGSSLKSADISNDLQNKEITVYPNPASGNLLKIDGLKNGAVVTAYSVMGVKLFEKQASSQLMEIQTKGLPKGAIFIIVKQNNVVIYKKQIICEQ
ncbi:MAG: carbohydrate-binding protein, partial [Bacteroidales bacterium]|nr:carbohydrate-binding protein [Bacteroidales bacterium]